MKSSMILSLLFLVFPLLASASDPFLCTPSTHRKTGQTTESKINEFVNAKLASINNKVGCDREDLFEEIQELLAEESGSKHAPLFNSWEGVPVSLHLEDQIYISGNINDRVSNANWCTRGSTTVSDYRSAQKLGILNSDVTPKRLSPSLNLCNQNVGLDKLNEFFAGGAKNYQYFLDSDKSSSVDKYTDIVNERYKSERGKLGGEDTGVVSYADISASIAGLKFYNNLYHTTENANNLFSCKAKRINRTQKKFDICDYVDESWDENINCQGLLSKKGKESYRGGCLPITLTEDNFRLCKNAIERAKSNLAPNTSMAVVTRMISPKCVNVYLDGLKNQVDGKPIKSSGSKSR